MAKAHAVRATHAEPARAPRAKPAAPELDRLIHERMRLGIVSALAAALVAARQRTPELWLATWLGAAIVALAIGGWTMVRKAYAVDDPILSGPGRRFWLSFLTPMAVGGLLTVVLYRAGLWHA